MKEEGGTLVMDVARSNHTFDSHARKLIGVNTNKIPGRDQTNLVKTFVSEDYQWNELPPKHFESSGAGVYRFKCHA